MNQAGPRHRSTITVPHAQSTTDVLAGLGGSRHGLTVDEAAVRLTRYGRNALPRGAPPTLLAVFLTQFKSPLIYVLLVAAIISLLIREWTDAGFYLCRAVD